jgi:hypothetical protein
VTHHRAKLTLLGRRLLVDRIVVDGMAVADAAQMVGVSRQTTWKWLRRFEADGEAGLADRTSRPARSPRALPWPTWTRSSPPATRTASVPTGSLVSSAFRARLIGDILHRHGISRLADHDRPSGVLGAFQPDAARGVGLRPRAP